MRLAVLGDPIEHSLSPALHTAALAAAGITGSYEARRVDQAGLSAIFAELRAGALDGANVTMPLKHAAAEQVDKLSDDASGAGAVNTLVRVGEVIVGHNTDVPGIRDVWRSASLPEHGPVLVLGAGGAAAGALVALANGREMHVAARRPEQAEAVIAATGALASPAPWGIELEAVVVNTTPLGMRGEMLPGFAAAIGLFDMAYGTRETPAVAAAGARHLPVATGHDLLVAQAALSFRLWTGRDPSLAAMRAAMTAEIERRQAVGKP